MPPNATSKSVTSELQFVFSLSTLLLLVSIAASYFSIQKLIRNSELVNHTNEVLLASENIISYMKDAETGQRGYLITLDPRFLQPYTGSYERVTTNYNRLRALTPDSPAQQKNLDQVRTLYETKFAQMRRSIALNRQTNAFTLNTAGQYEAMVQGKITMDALRAMIDRIKTHETRLLADRVGQQQLYTTYTPFLLILTALISILITTFAYLRIRRDLDERVAKQQRADSLYVETTGRIAVLEDITQRIAAGDYSVRSSDAQPDDLGRIARTLNQMAASLDQTFTDLTNRNWLQAGAVRLSEAIRGQRALTPLANRLIDALAEQVNAPLGTVYLANSDRSYALAGSYAALNPAPTVRAGEGLIGQAIERRKTLVVQDLPPDYSRVSSSLGSTRPTALLIAPLIYADACIGVIELGLLRKPGPLDLDFIEQSLEPIAIGVNAAQEYARLQNLLEETQAQAEELQAQHNELENLNSELETQTQKLQASEEELRVQQEELQQTNTELEERGLLLEERNDEIQRKADELELATRYKSEFLANMSHELRTPLNSILLLSRLLSENTDENLTDDQIEYANVIRSSGNGLLGLIDEILDLSKIEAGQMTLDVQPTAIAELTDELQSMFSLLAKEKGLDFAITVGPDVPETIDTDAMRLGQILKNLLSNALKFTATGRVGLTINRDQAQADMICFVVTDTGVGIAPEKQPLVFEAFKQADGSTKRKYGGTGLGLSISRELAKLLGGEITLRSRVNEGSEFTVSLPVSGARPAVPSVETTYQPHFGPTPDRTSPADTLPADRPRLAATRPTPPPETQTAHTYLSPSIPEAVSDDRDTIVAGDRTILIVEDDANFAKSLLEYSRKKGYKGIVAVRGDEGLKLAFDYKPLAILLDIQLPVLNGWEVMDALKADPQTRPIPVHIMSSYKVKNESLLKGAIDFMDKPVAFEQMPDVFKKIEHVLNRAPRKVLIVEDNPKHAKALAYYLETFNISSELRSNITEGIDALKREEVDCVILDMGIPDHKAYETLDEARKNPGLENLPIIIFTGKSLSLAEELKIKKYADSIIVKTAHSYQRMLDEVSLFLHVVEEHKQTARANGASGNLGDLNQVLTGKTVLVADDDVRNIFSLSKALEQYNMTVVAALDGAEALQKLAENPGVDVVLLDMMMPRMDGYETARKIREQYQWKTLPVIAVTAKAMTGDREKCIQAGASDYITKPVDIDQLVSLLRVWLYERS